RCPYYLLRQPEAAVAALFSALGSPLEIRWSRATASSAKSVSSLPARMPVYRLLARLLRKDTLCLE
ncbi:MAG: hypothetical protein ACYDGY_05855, partial [Acidimicrobiales bacterium]